jgi:predicted nucleic acid-binding protein
MPDSFVDTNILIYLASADSTKAERVEALLAQGGTASVQVLNEVANVAQRKMKLSWNETNTFLAVVRGLLTVEPMTIETHETGLAVSERYRLSVYDGLIVGAALLAGCETLWSEDMQDGMVIHDRLRIRNPFSLA